MSLEPLRETGVWGRRVVGCPVWQHEGLPGTPPGCVCTARLAWQGHAWLGGAGPLWCFSSSFLLAFTKFASRTGFAKPLCYPVTYQLIPAPIPDFPLHLDASCQLLSSWNRLLVGLPLCSETGPRVRPRLLRQHGPLPSGLRLPPSLPPGPATLTSPVMLQPYRQLSKASSCTQQSKCTQQAKHLPLPKGALCGLKDSSQYERETPRGGRGINGRAEAFSAAWCQRSR